MEKKNAKKLQMTIIYSLPSGKRKESGFLDSEDDTVSSVDEMIHVLEGRNIEITKFPIRPEEIDKLKTISADLILNYIEWTGIDLPFAMQAFDVLDSLSIPYTGATKENYFRTTDKILMKNDLILHKLPTPVSVPLQNGIVPKKLPFPFPAIVKLAREHGGVGLSDNSVVKSVQDMTKTIQYLQKTFPEQPIIIEEFIDGREFEVGLIEQNGTVVVLPPSENVYSPTSKGIILTYEGRWAQNAQECVDCITNLADLTTTQLSRMISMCKEAYHSLHFRDYARFDLRMKKDGTIYLIEVNSNPGLDDNITSSLPQGFHAVGMSFADFLVEIIKAALLRTGKTQLLKLVA
jgi:D-alanine-D-alanine ligase